MVARAAVVGDHPPESGGKVGDVVAVDQDLAFGVGRQAS